jgi:hypothetical protein
MNSFHDLSAGVKKEIEEAVRAAYRVIAKCPQEYDPELFGEWCNEVKACAEAERNGIACDWLALLEECDTLCRHVAQPTPVPEAYEAHLPKLDRVVPRDFDEEIEEPVVQNEFGENPDDGDTHTE